LAISQIANTIFPFRGSYKIKIVGSRIFIYLGAKALGTWE